VTFSLKDRIALLIASGLGAAFAYLSIRAGYGGTVVGGFYGFVVIPLVVAYVADKRKLVVWQACIIPFAIYILAENAFVGGIHWTEGLSIFLGFWAIGAVISSPVPAYFYLQGARKRRSYRVELFLVGLAFVVILCSLSFDPILVFEAAAIWIAIWFVKSLWDLRLDWHMPDSKRTLLVVGPLFILGCSIPILTIMFFKQRAFSMAVAKDHLIVAARLVRVGADPNALDASAQTALRGAAWIGDAQAVAALLSMGAKVDLEAKEEFQGLMPSGSALAVAASAGRAEICTSLLAAGANVNKKNQHGTTPLIAALTHSSIECVPILLDHGADVNARDALGETPLMLLAHWGPDNPIAQRALDQVLAAGADVLAKDDKGQTAEDWAILYHRQDLEDRLRKMRESRNEK
jgi:hypothetical protein